MTFEETSLNPYTEEGRKTLFKLQESLERLEQNDDFKFLYYIYTYIFPANVSSNMHTAGARNNPNMRKEILEELISCSNFRAFLETIKQQAKQAKEEAKAVEEEKNKALDEEQKLEEVKTDIIDI